MLMDAYRDERPETRNACRTGGHSHNSRRIQIPTRLSMTTAHNLLFVSDCALNTMIEVDMQQSMGILAPRLSIHSPVISEVDSSAAEMVIGATVRLSDKMISPTPRTAAEDPTNILHRQRQFMRTHTRILPRPYASESKLIKDLATCLHLHLRQDRVRRLLEPPYDSSFRLISRGTKNFRMQRGARVGVGDVDRPKLAVPDTPPQMPCGHPSLPCFPDSLCLHPVYSPLSTCPLPSTATNPSSTTNAVTSSQTHSLSVLRGKSCPTQSVSPKFGLGDLCLVDHVISAMLMDAYRDERPETRNACRTGGHRYNSRRIQIPARLSMTTAHNLLFVSDCALNTMIKVDMQQSMDILAPRYANFGPTFNTDKEVVMHQLSPNTQHCDPSRITADGNQIKTEDKFAYLGKTLSSSTRIDSEVTHRSPKPAEPSAGCRTPCGIVVTSSWLPNQRCTRLS
nr:unnamed protein product [Spirometra erinaceieuropaei]